jgi:hypothetical protein
MTNIASVSQTVYQDLAVAFGVLAAIVILSALARAAFSRFPGAGKKGGGSWLPGWPFP